MSTETKKKEKDLGAGLIGQVASPPEGTEPRLNRHTPGLWHTGPSKEGHVFAGDQLVAGCMGYSRNFNDGDLRAEQLANARLIAAAPELLAACHHALHMLGHTCASLGKQNCSRCHVAAAIAKAEGR